MTNNKNNILRQKYNDYIYKQKNTRKNTVLKLVQANMMRGTMKRMHLNIHL